MTNDTERLLELARRSPEHARARILSAPPARGADTTDSACWVQTVLPPDATTAERAKVLADLRQAAREAAGGARGWARPIEVEEEREDSGRLLLTIFVFRAVG